MGLAVFIYSFHQISDYTAATQPAIELSSSNLEARCVHDWQCPAPKLRTRSPKYTKLHNALLCNSSRKIRKKDTSPTMMFAVFNSLIDCTSDYTPVIHVALIAGYTLRILHPTNITEFVCLINHWVRLSGNTHFVAFVPSDMNTIKRSVHRRRLERVTFLTLEICNSNTAV